MTESRQPHGAPRVARLALVAALLASSVPAFAASGDTPDLGPGVSVARMPGGGTSIVRPAQGAPVAAVELWFRAPSSGFGPKPAVGISRLAAQLVAASKPIVGAPLGQAITESGGRLAVTVYTDSIAISAIVPAAAARTTVKAMTTAFFAPVATEDGFRSAQRDVAQEAAISGFDPETVVRDDLFGQLFASAPQRYSALGGPKDVASLAFADVKAFATRAFRAQNATLVICGAVDPGIGEAAVSGRPAEPASSPEAAAPAELATPASEPLTRDFSQPSGGYGWIGPPILAEREATAMDFIADYLFRGDDGVVARQVAAKYPSAFLVGQFITLHDPGVMFVAYSDKHADDVRALVDDGLTTIRKPLPAATFASALDAFKYHLLSDLQTPSQLADNYGWYTVEGAPAYAPGTGGESGAYFKAANSLTPDFVAAVAMKYLGKAPAVVALRPAPPKEKAKTP